MADVEVLVSGVGTVGHCTAQLVRPVPHNLKTAQHTQLQASLSNVMHFEQTASTNVPV